MNQGKNNIPIGKIKKLVVKTALGSWYRLAPHTRSWISLEDLVQDGMLWVTDIGIAKWDEHRGSLENFLRIGLIHHFDELYVGRFAYVCHNEGKLVSWDTDISPSLRESFPHKKIEFWREAIVTELVTCIFRSASRELQNEMLKWFFNLQRLHPKTTQFCLLRGEFLSLAHEVGFNEQDCQFLLHNQSCLEAVSSYIGQQPIGKKRQGKKREMGVNASQ